MPKHTKPLCKWYPVGEQFARVWYSRRQRAWLAAVHIGREVGPRFLSKFVPDVFNGRTVIGSWKTAAKALDAVTTAAAMEDGPRLCNLRDIDAARKVRRAAAPASPSAVVNGEAL